MNLLKLACLWGSWRDKVLLYRQRPTKQVSVHSLIKFLFPHITLKAAFASQMALQGFFVIPLFASPVTSLNTQKSNKPLCERERTQWGKKKERRKKKKKKASRKSTSPLSVIEPTGSYSRAVCSTLDHGILSNVSLHIASKYSQEI